MSELESEESVAKRRNQQGQGLNILTPHQILSRLPITLAQLKARNNSQKLKNEIKQLLCSLYCSKKLMETIFMNTENSKSNEPHRFRLFLADKRNLKNPNKNITLGNLSIFYTWKNIKSALYEECINNKLKISAPFWNDTFNLPDGYYSNAGIQDNCESIIEKHVTLTENRPVQIYPNKIKNRIVFKIKAGYKLELLSSEMMKLLGSTKKEVDQDDQLIKVDQG